MSDLYEKLRTEAERVADEWVAEMLETHGLSMREQEVISLVGRMVTELSISSVLHKEAARLGS